MYDVSRCYFFGLATSGTHVLETVAVTHDVQGSRDRSATSDQSVKRRTASKQFIYLSQRLVSGPSLPGSDSRISPTCLGIPRLVRETSS